jgi:hypothetical protein
MRDMLSGLNGLFNEPGNLPRRYHTRFQSSATAFPVTRLRARLPCISINGMETQQGSDQKVSGPGRSEYGCRRLIGGSGKSRRPFLRLLVPLSLSSYTNFTRALELL